MSNADDSALRTGSRLAAVMHTLHAVAIGLWLGALGMVGVTAAIIFPTMKEIDPVLPSFEGSQGEWPPGEQGIIAAGMVMRKIFAVSDVVQAVCAGVAGAAAIVLLRAMPQRGVLLWLRAVLTLIAAAIAYWVVLALAPSMDQSLDLFLEAARSPEGWSAGQSLRDDFDAKHRVASGAYSTTASLLLLTGAMTLADGAARARRAERRG